ncbi:MAG: putative bifunctional diguanylate cyclase/phosphodiesterase, partial [Acidimicrobiales bacterium]
QADRAMYDAKRTGSGVTLYEPAMEANGTSQVGLLGELRRAIPEGELRLHFQPKISVRSGDVVGLETLIRWQHPQRGILTPAAFLPVAEASGLVRAVSAWVMPTALEQLNRWMSQGLDVSVAVNVSAQDLADDGFPAQVGRWLDESGVPANQLVVELTEASAISDTERGTGALAGLRALGARVSLDDFGSGYSSLAYLAQLPLDEVKLDRAFLTSSLDADGFMLRSVVEIGHHLGLSVVAEGVETVETYRRLASFGCDSVQGYVCAQPMPAERVAGFVARWQPDEWATAGGQAATVSAVGGTRAVRRSAAVHRQGARRG